jgi:group I intron endonuclease
MASGIYKIVNTKNGKLYVGSAVNIIKRWGEHLCLLRHGIHHSPHFQYAYNKDAEESFKFEIIELVDNKEYLIPKEQIWLDHYQSYIDKLGYNIHHIAGSPLGMKHTDKTKEKISIANKGRKLSPEHKAKLLILLQERWKDPIFRNKMIGVVKKLWENPEYQSIMSKSAYEQWKNPEFRKNMIEKTKKMWNSPQTRLQITNSIIESRTPELRKQISSSLLGIPKSIGHRNNISDGRKGMVFSPEHKDNMSKAASKLWDNPEFKDKMNSIFNSPESLARRSAAQTGKTMSAESRARMSISKKKMWEEKRRNKNG